MVIKITNYICNESLNISLPLIIGEVIPGKDSKIYIQNLTFLSKPVIWPVINGKFKALVSLNKGENKIKFEHKNSTLLLILHYKPLNNKRFVRLVYIKCKDDEGLFQAPIGENNSIKSACNRISLAGRMLQTFTSDKLQEHDLEKRTFCLEEENDNVTCHIFTSALSLNEAYNFNQQELWSHFAVELMNSSLRVGNDCKFLAFLSFTRYINNTNSIPQTHQEVLNMTKGYLALGGGGLALFGSGCLHTWPETVEEIPWRFGDKRRIDKMELMDDSANRGWHWACYSTGLGATLHELGHTFDLGHTSGGIMGRGFDDINKYFIIDMFYHDHIFQKEHNPYYQKSSTCEYKVSLLLTSPPTEESLSKPLQNVHISNKRNSFVPASVRLDDKVPWKLPHPTDSYIECGKCPVKVGGAYWTRSSALILYYHKWFNADDIESTGSISFEGTKISSPNGVKVIEFKDQVGMSFHHLEFLEENGGIVIDLTCYDIPQHIPEGVTEISFIAEDKLGNIIKSKLDIDIFQLQKQQE